MSAKGWLSYTFFNLLFGLLIWLGGISAHKSSEEIASREMHMVIALLVGWVLMVYLVNSLCPPTLFPSRRDIKKRQLLGLLVLVSLILALAYGAYQVYLITRSA